MYCRHFFTFHTFLHFFTQIIFFWILVGTCFYVRVYLFQHHTQIAHGRARYFPNGYPLSSTRLREIGGDILAGPYLVADFLDSRKQNAFIQLTSPDLIKCRSRFFALHFRVLPSKMVEKIPPLDLTVSHVFIVVYRGFRRSSTFPWTLNLCL